MLSAVSRHGATAFIAEPVDSPGDEEDEQGKLEDGNLPENVEHRNVRPVGVYRVQRRIGIDVAQAAEPEEVDNHQAAVEQSQDVDDHSPAAQFEGRLRSRPAFQARVQGSDVVHKVGHIDQTGRGGYD